MRRFIRGKPTVQRIWLTGIAALALVAATAEAAHACFFGCIYHFGYITVSDGELYYYNGCYEYTSGGQTYITCYYSDALN